MTISLGELIWAGVGIFMMLMHCFIAADYEMEHHPISFRRKMFIDYGIPAILWIAFLIITDQLMKYGWLR